VERRPRLPIFPALARAQLVAPCHSEEVGDVLGRDPRLERLKHKVPAWYVPLHLGVIIGVFGGASVALLLLRPSAPLTASAWIAAVATVLFADFVEYALHRWPMHRRRRLTRAFFRNHTIAHHRYFTYETMGIRSFSEVTFVLSSIPVILVTLGLILTIAGLLVAILGLNGGMFVAGVIGLWTTAKQVLHLAFHLPDRWMKLPVLRGRAFQALKEHHAIHHDPRLMRKWNFNIAVPVFDALFGTLTWERSR